jgi:hypothetical protein
MNNQDNERAIKLLESYKKKRIADNKRYHDKYKKDPVRVEAARQRAKKHYYESDCRNKYYEENRELQRARTSWNYYKSHNRERDFMIRKPEYLQMLVEAGSISIDYIQEVSGNKILVDVNNEIQ